MILDVVKMVFPVLLMIGIGCFCNKKQVFDGQGLKALKAIIGQIMLPVTLFNAFLTAEYNLRVVVVFVVVYVGYCLAITIGCKLRPISRPYGKFMPFLLAGGEGGMLGYALYGMLVGSQSGFAVVDLGQTVFAYTVWLGLLTSVDGGRVEPKALLKNMFSNRCFQGMALGILLGATGIGGWIASSAFGGIYQSTVQMITAPVSAIVLLMVGYELNLKLELMGPVLKTMLARLAIMAALLGLSSLIIFRIFPFDKNLQIALMVLYTLPAPFIIPIFAEVGRDGEYVSTSLSVYTLLTVVLFAVITAYSIG